MFIDIQRLCLLQIYTITLEKEGGHIHLLCKCSEAIFYNWWAFLHMEMVQSNK